MTWRTTTRQWLNARLDSILAERPSPLTTNPLGLPTAGSAAAPKPGESRLAAAIPVKAPAGSEPSIVQVPNADGSTTIYGLPGTLITGGFVVPMGEFNPLLQGRNAVDVYEKMRRTDSQVEKTLEMCVAPIVGAKWDIRPDPDADGSDSQKEEIAEFCRENIFGALEYKLNGVWHTQTWNEAVRSMLLMLTFGCSAYEEVYRIDGENVRLACLADLPPKTFYQWDVEEDGRTLRALIQLGYRGQLFERLEVPAERLNVFTYRQEGADFWGRSILRSAYSHWYAKNLLYRIRNIAAERTGVGVPCITLPPNASREDHDLAVLYVTQLAAHQKTGLVLPAGATFEIKGVTGSTFNSMEDVAHHNEQISFVALDFFSNLGRGGSSGASGNRALAQGQGKFFTLALQNTADFVAQRFTRVTLRRLVAYNFGPDAPVPLLTVANVEARSFEQVMQVLSQAATAGLVKSDAGLRAEIRKEAGMPEETDEDVMTKSAVGSPQSADGKQDSGSGIQDSGKKNPDDDGEGGDEEVQASETRYQPSRELKDFERKHDFSGHAKRQDVTGAQIARVLRQEKPRLAREAARQLARTPLSHHDSIDLGFDHPLATRIRPLLERAKKFGYSSVFDERKKATGRHRGVAVKASEVALAEKGKAAKSPKRTTQFQAEATISDFTNQVGVRAKSAAVDLKKQGLAGDDLVQGISDALASGSDSFLDRIGAEASRMAVSGGRADALEELAPEIARYVRTEAMDHNTCEPCQAGDGTEWNSFDEIDWSPGDDCEGGDACRGQVLPVFEDEGVVVLE